MVAISDRLIYTVLSYDFLCSHHIHLVEIHHISKYTLPKTLLSLERGLK